MRGRLITIEGTDASGKSTQLSLLCDRFARENRDFKKIAFPRYDSDSSALVRMYLGGEFGENVSNVNAYAASSFFAVDRVASYLREWGGYLNDGGCVLLDRYTTSNAIYQSSKLPESERDGFCNWLFDFEYRLLGLPEPDLVIFLDMPPHFAEQLLRARGEAPDVHERDKEYMRSCYNSACAMAEKFSWHRIPCAENGKIKTIDEIHAEIYSAVLRVLPE